MQKDNTKKDEILKFPKLLDRVSETIPYKNTSINNKNFKNETNCSRMVI